MSTTAEKALHKLRRQRAKHEVELYRLAPKIRELEVKVQDEKGLCACWMLEGDPRCLCGVLGRRRRKTPANPEGPAGV